MDIAAVMIRSKGTFGKNCDLLDPVLLRAYVTRQTDIYLSSIREHDSAPGHYTIWGLGLLQDTTAGRAVLANPTRGRGRSNRIVRKVHTGRDPHTVAFMNISLVARSSKDF